MFFVLASASSAGMSSSILLALVALVMFVVGISCVRSGGSGGGDLGFGCFAQMLGVALMIIGLLLGIFGLSAIFGG